MTKQFTKWLLVLGAATFGALVGYAWNHLDRPATVSQKRLYELTAAECKMEKRNSLLLTKLTIESFKPEFEHIDTDAIVFPDKDNHCRFEVSFDSFVFGVGAIREAQAQEVVIDFYNTLDASLISRSRPTFSVIIAVTGEKGHIYNDWSGRFGRILNYQEGRVELVQPISGR